MGRTMRGGFLLSLLVLWIQGIDASGSSSLRGSDGNTAAETRVIGGDTVQDSNRYEYFTLFHGSHMCGGVLFAEDLVLTAAHCQNSAREVHVGRMTNPRARIPDDSELIAIEEEIPHPYWEWPLSDSFSFDIMIVKLREKSTKQYAKLNMDHAIPTDGETLTLIGMGSLGGTDFPENLQEVELDYVNHDQCRDTEPIGDVTSDMLCAMAPDKSACHGDSGGPLFIKGETIEDDVVVGTVSWGRGCANENFPGVYARVSFVYNWILREACRLSPGNLPDYMVCEGGSGFERGGDEDSQSPSLSMTPTQSPSMSITPTSSVTPSSSPSEVPSATPSTIPSEKPSMLPSEIPSKSPSTSQIPSTTPSDIPSDIPSQSAVPSELPSEGPSQSPSELPSQAPSDSQLPSEMSSEIPTSSPSENNRVDFVGWGPKVPLGHCQGDCDSDDQCAGDMVCYERGTMKIPGCYDLNLRRLADYCVHKSDLRR